MLSRVLSRVQSSFSPPINESFQAKRKGTIVTTTFKKVHANLAGNSPYSCH